MIFTNKKKYIFIISNQEFFILLLDIIPFDSSLFIYIFQVSVVHSQSVSKLDLDQTERLTTFEYNKSFRKI